jgi:hypothetical protein
MAVTLVSALPAIILLSFGWLLLRNLFSLVTPAPEDLLGADRLASPASFPILPNNFPHHFQLKHRPSTPESPPSPSSSSSSSSSSPPLSYSATVLALITERQSRATQPFPPASLLPPQRAGYENCARHYWLSRCPSRHPLLPSLPTRKTNETPSPTSTDIHDTNHSSAEKLYFNLHSHSLSPPPLSSHHSPPRSSRSRPFSFTPPLHPSPSRLVWAPIHPQPPPPPRPRPRRVSLMSISR